MDPNRIYPPDHAILHNSVSPEGDDIRRWSDDDWANWFSQIGYTRTYNKQYIGLTYKGRPTYSAVQKCVVPNGDGKDIYSDTWRVIWIVDNPEQRVTWGCGNWDINRRCDNYEFYGRYDNKELPDNAMKAFADDVRNTMEKLNGGRTLIKGHKEVSLGATGCPNRMMEKRDMSVDMINNPDKYKHVNVKEQPKPQLDYNNVTDIPNKIYVVNVDKIQLINIISKQVIKEFVRGEELEISAVFSFEGVEYGFTEYSFKNRIWNGFKMSELKLKEEPKPEPVDNRPEYEKNAIDGAEVILVVKDKTDLVEIPTGAIVSSFVRGEELQISRTTRFKGVDYAITTYSKNLNIWRGMRLDSLVTKDEYLKQNKMEVDKTQYEADMKELADLRLFKTNADEDKQNALNALLEAKNKELTEKQQELDELRIDYQKLEEANQDLQDQLNTKPVITDGSGKPIYEWDLGDAEPVKKYLSVRFMEWWKSNGVRFTRVMPFILALIAPALALLNNYDIATALIGYGVSVPTLIRILEAISDVAKVLKGAPIPEKK